MESLGKLRTALLIVNVVRPCRDCYLKCEPCAVNASALKRLQILGYHDGPNNQETDRNYMKAITPINAQALASKPSCNVAVFHDADS
jgi:hypothetical protein